MVQCHVLIVLNRRRMNHFSKGIEIRSLKIDGSGIGGPRWKFRKHGPDDGFPYKNYERLGEVQPYYLSSLSLVSVATATLYDNLEGSRLKQRKQKPFSLIEL